MNSLFQEISKSDWMNDSEASYCLNCTSHFKTTLRRHHCRYCGVIFCKNCIHSKATLQNKNLKKICVKCLTRLKKHEETLKTRFKHHPSIDFQNSNTLRSESKSSGELMLENGRIYVQSENPQQEILGMLAEISEPHKELDTIFESFLWNRVKEMLEDCAIDEEWTETVVKLVDCCVKSVCCSAKFRGDDMDLNSYVKIQPIICNDLSFTNFITGVAFQGKLASNKMGKMLQSPKVLIIKKFSVLASSSKTLISMEKLIEQEETLESMLLKKILSLGPNVVICGNTMTQSFITNLSLNNITAILKVKPKILKLLARATGSKVLKNCEALNYEKEFLGGCGFFYQEIRGDRTLMHFTGLRDRTGVGTIFISGKNSFELVSIKKILRTLIVEYRNMLIEKSLLGIFRVRNLEQFFLGGYERSIVIKQFVVCNNVLCTCPYDFATEFYDKKDQTLGEFLILNARRFEQTCENCKNIWGLHVCYYLREDGRIKIRSFQSKSMNCSQNIIFNRECKICGKFEKHKSQLTNTQWEYSFYKFINNFFTKSTTISHSIDCKHNFFHWSKFNFYAEGIKIEIEWEDNPYYTVLYAINLPDTTQHYQSLLNTQVTELKDSGTAILQSLLESCEGLIETVDDIKKNEIKTQILFLKNLNEEVSTIISQVSEELTKIEIVKPISFTNLLEVETAKRLFYLKSCEFKKKITNLKVLTNIAGKKERTSVAENYLQDSFTTGKPWRFTQDGESSKNKSVLLENLCKSDESLSHKEFLLLKKGNHTLLPGTNSLFIPVDEFDTVSIIAHALNSTQYSEEILLSLPNPTETHKIESELLNCSEKHFQIQFSTYASEDLSKNEEFTSLYGDFITFNVHVIYPRQFQLIRNTVMNDHLSFLCSFYMSENKKEQLGKSKATFSKTHDGRFIIKTMEEKEFVMFKELAPNYFRHFCNAEYHSMPSRLIKTLGCFRVFVKNHSQGRTRVDWVLLFENLGAVMPADTEVYDLKGSFNERRYVQKKEKRTKMDKNFLEDFEGVPLMISLEAKQLLDMSIWNDTLFLSKKNIVDYSLLLMVSTKQRLITYGVIDYVSKYTLEKAMERKLKKAVNITDPTIARPVKYKNRFRDSLSKRFFVEQLV